MVDEARLTVRRVDMIKVELRCFATFRDLFGRPPRVIEVTEDSDVLGLLDIICDSEERRRAVFGTNSSVKRYVKILLNGQDVQFLKGTGTRLAHGDVVSMFPPVGGG